MEMLIEPSRAISAGDGCTYHSPPPCTPDCGSVCGYTCGCESNGRGCPQEKD